LVDGDVSIVDDDGNTISSKFCVVSLVDSLVSIGIDVVAEVVLSTTFIEEFDVADVGEDVLSSSYNKILFLYHLS
jgi:hypothetical protein